MNRPPIIGITCSLWASENTTNEPFKHDYQRVGSSLIEAVEQAGGVPILLPSMSESESMKNMLSAIDGLLLSGGDDPDPAYWSEENLYPQAVIHPLRDAAEFALLQAALDTELPIFGICRGMQLLNIALGGGLYQDSSLFPQASKHRSAEGETELFHIVRFAKQSRLHKLAGQAELSVNSRHHQLLGKIGDGLRVTATAPDGCAEAIEATDPARYRLGVQWHPESSLSDKFSCRLFSDFVQACHPLY